MERRTRRIFFLLHLCRLGYTLCHSLSWCMHLVVPKNINPHDLKKKKSPRSGSGSATAISLPKDFSHKTKNLAMIFGGDILSMLIERTTSPPLFTTPSL